jgi:hypothetical protein
VLKALRAEYNLNTEVKDTGNPFDGVGTNGALPQMVCLVTAHRRYSSL